MIEYKVTNDAVSVRSGWQKLPDTVLLGNIYLIDYNIRIGDVIYKTRTHAFQEAFTEEREKMQMWAQLQK